MEINKASNLIIAYSHAGPPERGEGVDMARIILNLEENAGFRPSQDCRIEVHTLPETTSDPEDYGMVNAMMIAWLTGQGFQESDIVEFTDMRTAVIHARNAPYKFVQCVWAVPLNDQVINRLDEFTGTGLKYSGLMLPWVRQRLALYPKRTSTAPPQKKKAWWEFWKK